MMDPTLMQVQLKRNSEDMQDYLKSLDDWENDMKKRDQLLKKQKPVLQKSVPPIRGKSAKVLEPTKKVVDKHASQVTKPDRIKSFDYDAWNKYNVDAACEDTPTSSSSSEGEEETEKGDDSDKRAKMAELEKERGNQLFKEGKYLAAVERYTRAISLDPNSHVIISNRAMAFIKLKMYVEAEADCNVSISLEEKYLKSWQRRATARIKLGKLQQALKDYEQVLNMDPSSKVTHLEIKKLQEQIAEQQQTTKHKITPTPSLPRDPKSIYPVKRLNSMRSKEPMVRIVIQEVHGCSSGMTGDSCVIGDSGVTEDSVVTEYSLMTENSVVTEDSSITGYNGNTGDHGVTIVDSVARVGGVGESNQDIINDKLDSYEHTLQSPVPVSTNVSCKSSAAGFSGVNVVPSVPVTSIEFMSQWRSLRGNSSILEKYFKSIPPSLYPVILNQSLETNVFTDILTIIFKNTGSINSIESVMDILEWLTRVPRFNMAVMFLSTKDKAKLTNIFQALYEHGNNSANNDTDTEKLKILANAYTVKL